MSAEKNTFDYIIVGGGSAGCVLANRLSADPQCKVLLVEAGGADNNILYHWPAGFAKMTKGIGSWGWSTVPQKHLQNRVVWFTQAKVIGGGSSINAQIYTRGNALDFDTWAQMGCKGWSYDDVLPYFRKSEDNDSFDNTTHGKGGPMGVSKPAAPLPIAEAFIRAAGQIGIPYNPDLASANPAGVGFYQLTQRNARRSSTATAYLKPIRTRNNLTVRLGTLTTRILLDANRAIGIAVADETGGETKLLATREVIISSGSIGSPKLLSNRVSDLQNICVTMESKCATICPVWAATCKTMSISASSPNARAITPMTNTANPIGPLLQLCDTCSTVRGPWHHHCLTPAASGMSMRMPPPLTCNSTWEWVQVLRQASQN